MAEIQKILSKRILTLDGAMGSLIQTHSLNELDYQGEILSDHPQDLKGNHDILSLTRPDIIHNIHSLYLEAGADIIETNTFNANAISQSDYGLEQQVYQLNLQSATIAKDVTRVFTKENPDYIHEIGVKWCIKQCEELLNNGVMSIHYYIMSGANAVTKVLKELNK